MSSLARQQYGKERVKVMRVHRGADGVHEVFEYEAGIALEGAFDTAYLGADNSSVVPTDTMKNTLQALGYTLAPKVLEPFALAVTQHFLGKYAQIDTVRLNLVQKLWSRLPNAVGSPSPIAFRQGGAERPFARVVATRDSTVLTAGFTDLLILKTTESGFVGYPKCDFTTLPETSDRILATSASAEWTFGAVPDGYDFEAARGAIMQALLAVFLAEYSPSVQRTLFQMGEAALAAVPEITGITLKLPNKHYLPVDLTRLSLGLPPQNELFLPTDEPHGQIEATITRD